MIRITIMTASLFIFLSFNYICADEILYEDAKGNKIIQIGEYGKKIQIMRDGKVAYEVAPRFMNEVSKKHGESNQVTTVGLLYNLLANRGSLKEQPQPFDDLTGDGIPDILFYEQGRVSNAVLRYYVLRLVSIKNGKAEEAEPYFGYFGEALHFDDFNNDGALELVNTDSEKYFLYSRDGIPISGYVLLFDKEYKKYYPANSMVGDTDIKG